MKISHSKSDIIRLKLETDSQQELTVQTLAYSSHVLFIINRTDMLRYVP